MTCVQTTENTQGSGTTIHTSITIRRRRGILTGTYFSSDPSPQWVKHLPSLGYTSLINYKMWTTGATNKLQTLQSCATAYINKTLPRFTVYIGMRRPEGFPSTSFCLTIPQSLSLTLSKASAFSSTAHCPWNFISQTAIAFFLSFCLTYIFIADNIPSRCVSCVLYCACSAL